MRRQAIREISSSDIAEALKNTVWDLGNEVLYELCRKHPDHDSAEVVIAKVLLIGRVYAAAIERRKNGTNFGDSFYINTVAPMIMESGIDQWLRGLPRGFSDASANAAIILHHNVMGLFCKISGMEKRSLASKYLHFHRPDLFFIFDSRSCQGIRASTRPIRMESGFVGDKEYEKFYRRCLMLRNDLAPLRAGLTPRELDKILLYLTEQQRQGSMSRTLPHTAAT